MRYNLYCKKCGKAVMVSTNDDGFTKIKTEDSRVHYLFDCPKCGEEIDVVKEDGNVRGYRK